MKRNPKVYFISGVSGVGKSSTLKYLKNHLSNEEYDVRDLDERGVPDGGGLDWLQKEIRHWLDVSKKNAKNGKATIICGFANPEFMEKVYKEDDLPVDIILLHASPEIIRKRLHGRHSTPETIKEIERASGMPFDQYIEKTSSFAAQFRSIFEKYRFNIIETDGLTPEEVSKEIISRL